MGLAVAVQGQTCVIQQLRGLWDSERDKARRRAARKLVALWEGEWEAQLQAALKKRYADQNYQRLRVQPDTSWNLARFTSEQMGAIYAKSPGRAVSALNPETGEVTPEPLPASYLANGALDLVLSAAASALPLVGNLFLRPLPCGTPEAPEISVDVITPDRVVVLEDPEDPNGMKAIAYLAGTEESGEIQVWTPDNHWILDPKTWTPRLRPGLDVGHNPYRMIPVVPVRSRWRVGSFWDTRDGDSLRCATIEAGCGLTGLSYLLKGASHKQPWISGEPHKEYPLNQILDAVSPIVLGPGASVGVLDIQPNFVSMVETLLARAGVVLNQFGITPAALRGTLDASSGVALKLKMVGLDRIHGVQRRLWTLWEHLLYRAAAAVASHHFSELYPVVSPLTPLLLDYAEVGPRQSAQERSALYLPWVQAGKVPAWWGLLKTFDLTEDEARQLADEALAENPTLPPLLPGGEL